MTPAHFIKNLFVSYQSFFRLLLRTLVPGKNTQARLTVRRFLVMVGFFPLLFIIQTMHWLGFMLDEVLFRGYRSIEVRSPVFIVGVPRSGTTFLHRLLARDRQRFTTFSLWELILAPSVSERKFWLGLGRLDRIIGAPFGRLIRWLERKLLGSLDSIHRISLSDEEEDYFLLVPIYACFLLILPFPFSDELGHLAFFDDMTPAADKERIMDFYCSCLKRHLYVRGSGKPFLSKNVSFSPMIGALAKTFPDSRIIATVRNPVHAVASHLSAMMAGAELFDNHARGNEFREQMIAVQRYAYTHILEAWFSEKRQGLVLVRMEDLQQNLAATVYSLYKMLGFKITPAFAGYIQEQDKCQKHYQSGHHYTLSAYGCTEEKIYQEFSDVFKLLDYPRPKAAMNPDGGLMPCKTEQPNTG